MASAADVEAVRARLGRRALADFEVVVRDDDGLPVVVRNAPFLADGTPMPTRYWLVDPELSTRVSRLESTGGVRDAESAKALRALLRKDGIFLTDLKEERIGRGGAVTKAPGQGFLYPGTTALRLRQVAQCTHFPGELLLAAGVFPRAGEVPAANREDRRDSPDRGDTDGQRRLARPETTDIAQVHPLAFQCHAPHGQMKNAAERIGMFRLCRAHEQARLSPGSRRYRAVAAAVLSLSRPR